jgi:hypothetical protein
MVSTYACKVTLDKVQEHKVIIILFLFDLFVSTLAATLRLLCISSSFLRSHCAWSLHWSYFDSIRLLFY